MAGSNMRPVLGKSEGDGAWRRLWAAWQQARAGAGSMVALAGDPGMGKSHLPAGEVLVAGGYRPRQASAALLRILPARSAAVVLEPVPEAIAAEIAGCADARLAELRRFCEGNPLYLSALADQPGHEAAGS